MEDMEDVVFGRQGRGRESPSPDAKAFDPRAKVSFSERRLRQAVGDGYSFVAELGVNPPTGSAGKFALIDEDGPMTLSQMGVLTHSGSWKERMLSRKESAVSNKDIEPMAGTPHSLASRVEQAAARRSPCSADSKMEQEMRKMNSVRFVQGDVTDLASVCRSPAGILKARSLPPQSPVVALLRSGSNESDDTPKDRAALRNSLGIGDEWATSSIDQLRRSRVERAAQLQNLTRSCGIQTREMYREHNEQVEQVLAEAHKRLNSGMKKLHNFPRRAQKNKPAPMKAKGVNDSVEGMLTMVVFIVLVSLLLGGMIWETHSASVNSRSARAQSGRGVKSPPLSQQQQQQGSPHTRNPAGQASGHNAENTCAGAGEGSAGGCAAKDMPIDLPPPTR